MNIWVLKVRTSHVRTHVCCILSSWDRIQEKELRLRRQSAMAKWPTMTMEDILIRGLHIFHKTERVKIWKDEVMSPSIIKARKTTLGASKESTSKPHRSSLVLKVYSRQRCWIVPWCGSPGSQHLLQDLCWENISKNLHYDGKRWMSLWISFRKLWHQYVWF